MNKFYNYLIGILFSPDKAFQKLSEDKSDYNLVILFISLAALGLLNGLVLPPQIITNPTPTAILLKNLFDALNNFSIITTPLIWFINTAFLYIILKFYSSKKEFKRLLTALGMISIVIVPISLIVNFFFSSSPQIRILGYFITIWSLYLEVIAVNKIYSVTKMKAFFAVSLGTIIPVVLFLIGMFLFVLNYLPQSGFN